MRNKNIFKPVLLAVLIAATAGQTAFAQNISEQSKREIVLRVLDQSKQNDYVPSAFFLHFPDKFGYKAVKEHLDFFHATNNDILKVQYETLPPHWEIKTGADFNKVQVLPEAYFEEQFKVIEDLVREAGHEALVIPTVYSPLMILQQATGNREIYKLAEKYPVEAEKAFEKLAYSIENYIRGARKRGADGFYVSSHGGNKEWFGQYNKVFLNYYRKWDKYISEVAAEVAPINILHICGGEYEDLSDWADYPASIINLPEFDLEKIKKAQEVFHRPIFGGLDHHGVLINGSIEEAKAQVDKILQNAPQNFILGANCTVPNETDYARLRELVDYVHTWRQTHK